MRHRGGGLEGPAGAGGRRRRPRHGPAASGCASAIRRAALLARAWIRRPPVTVQAGLKVFAHDLWAEPTNYQPRVGEAFGVALRVGEGFRGDPVPRKPERIVRFNLVGPGGSRPLEGEGGAEPAGFGAGVEPGIHVVEYRTHPIRILLDADRFEQYLAEEGLELVAALRRARGETGAPGREIYSRCVKSLVRVGDGSGGHDRLVGHPLELVPESDPFALAPGADLAVRVIYAGKPLEHAFVAAFNREAPENRQGSHSDAAGRVTFRIDRPGAWLVKCVHMISVAEPAAADWESLWAALTFQTPAEEKQPTPRPTGPAA